MNEMWAELAKQVPALVTLVTLVVFFLRHSSQDRDKFIAALDRNTKAMQDLDATVRCFNRQQVS